MLKSRQVALDFKGFRHKKSGFIIKELTVSTKKLLRYGVIFTPNFIQHTLFE